MIVCCCKAVTDQKIAELIAAGATSVEAVAAACGACTDCGSCRDAIEDMLEEHAAPARVEAVRRLNVVPARAA
jgi:bacterioferritin-associated ferredoxin